MQNIKENQNIGKNIRLYRILAGFSVKALSSNISKSQGLEIKAGSIRAYEKGKEKIPAVSLHAIAAETKTDISLFHQPANPAILLNNSNKIHLLEAYSLISCNATRDSILYIARRFAKMFGDRM